MNQKYYPLVIINRIILIVAALNWGLVGFFDFNLVHYLFSPYRLLEKIVYCLVGISGLFTLYTVTKTEGLE
ncbi:DUF378 domain-containing protein [Candidatus Odyssella thessalonicensis]|uniref:DUF378 domain-containing protein n=1 Tax=Candidatus Odyssella thessalonicensis TaxID=84647 RepID=UPI000225B242|nr:DUF378 domain-containing protein [Candidatus Odyssella thessalonicensis]